MAHIVNPDQRSRRPRPESCEVARVESKRRVVRFPILKISAKREVGLPRPCANCGTRVFGNEEECGNCGTPNPAHRGRQSTPQPPRQAQTAFPFRPLSIGLTGILVGSLGVVAALSVFNTLLFLAYWEAWRGFFGPGQPSISASTFREIENLAVSFAVATVIFSVVPYVLFLVWHNHAYKSAESARRDLKWSSGWAVRGWFIPGANLVIPKLVMNQVELGAVTREAHRKPESSRSRTLGPLGASWWGTWVVALVLISVSFFLQGERGDDGLLVLSAYHALTGASAMLAALYVWAIGRRLA